MKKRLNFKKLLYTNATSTLKKDLFQSVESIEEEKDTVVNQMKSKLFELGNPVNMLEHEFSEKEIREKRTQMSKENYHFPDLVNIGTIVNEKHIYSKIMPENSFITEIPFLIPLQRTGVAIMINHKYKERINEIIQQIGIEAITAIPDGLCKVTLIDKSGAGSNFPILSGLHEKFVDGKVLSEDLEIENELENIKNSMSAIAQSISANGFESIEEYNLNTNEVPQQYNYVFVNGFPTGFNKKATENLMSLIESGSKSGIYVFMTITYDPAYGLGQQINSIPLNQIIKQMTTFEYPDRPHELLTKKIIPENIEVLKFPLRNEEEFKILVNNKYKIIIKEFRSSALKDRVSYLNNIIKDLNLKPVINIEKAYPKEEDFWSKDSSKGVVVPIGKKGIENVYLSLGINEYGEDQGTHHVMIGGATGSGKTVLIHDIILLLSMLYSPKEIQFYLLDYKEGTEFALYKDYPYVNILSMKSEVEFGHEVLDKAIKVIEERGDLFKEVGATNLVSYNSLVSEDKKIPRIIIIIDEFQVLLPKDQKTATKTNERLEDLARRGRSFGVNMILATQTLKGVDLEPAIMSNIPIRIGLSMDQKDAAKIFSEDNTVAKFLNDPGEGIYNGNKGNSKSNVPFQAFKAIGSSVEETMKIVIDHMNKNLSIPEIEKLYEDRFVYNGEIPGKFEKNEHVGIDPEKIYIGEPAGLSKEHMYLKFENDFGENMIMVGPDQEKASSIFTYMIKQIANQENSTVKLFNFNNHLQDFFEDSLAEPVKNKKVEILENKTSEATLADLYKEFTERKENDKVVNSKIFIFLFYIESSKLYSGASFSNKNIKMLEEILKNGPEYGIHLVTYANDYSTLTDNDMSRDLSKFKKKIALKGGNSTKVFGTESSIAFSKSDKSVSISIVDTGVTSREPAKFKPYIYEQTEKGA